jgi:uncharacterized protein
MSNSKQERKGERGFAAMDAERQREIARKGGRAAHEQGTAHQFSSEEAREAGRKGGIRVSQNRQHMAEIGRRGGEARSQTGRQRDSGVGERGGEGSPGVSSQGGKGGGVDGFGSPSSNQGSGLGGNPGTSGQGE